MHTVKVFHFLQFKLLTCKKNVFLKKKNISQKQKNLDLEGKRIVNTRDFKLSRPEFLVKVIAIFILYDINFKYNTIYQMLNITSYYFMNVTIKFLVNEV